MNIEIMVFNRETKVISTLLLKNGVNKISEQFVQISVTTYLTACIKNLITNSK
jgi:hypothetical protein